MQRKQTSSSITREDGRIVIHFDYDCFYASVVENENPSLKQQCLAIQQKQIIVTCNYEARKRGLHKLQLISEAKKLCPEVVIVLGEDISRFRDASKELYRYLKQFSWNDKVERLGFDEVWMDITDIVDYNMELLNPNALRTSFFQLCREDPTQGFDFDASTYSGHTFPEKSPANIYITEANEYLALRLRLGSHLAKHIRQKLEDEKGYTSTVGISTSKLLSKLVGNIHKPRGQTTIIPPYGTNDELESNVVTFLDDYDIGKIPGIGFKLAQKLREFVLDRAAEFDAGLVYGGTKESVTVRDVRLHPGVSSETLEELLGGPGSPHGIGRRVMQLLHGVDDTDVSLARVIPRQISIEDSYIRLDTLPELVRQLTALSRSLITRMRKDLLHNDDDGEDDDKDEDVSPDAAAEDHTPAREDGTSRRWLAHPRTVRLSTRPRLPRNADGTRTRSFKRISHSASLPPFIFNTVVSIDALAEKLVHETLIPMFRKLHPEKAGWNLSLVNVAVTNMLEMAGDSRTANGRNIGTMFRRQGDVLKDFRVVDDGEIRPADERYSTEPSENTTEANEQVELSEDIEEAQWDDGTTEWGLSCSICGSSVPSFALSAHQRFHSLGD